MGFSWPLSLGLDDDSSDGECEKQDNAVGVLRELVRGGGGFTTLTNGKFLCPLGEWLGLGRVPREVFLFHPEEKLPQK